MDPNYRASDKHWRTIEALASCNVSDYSCILELRARIEALEAAQQPEQITYEPQWHRLSEREPQDCDRCIYRVCPMVRHVYGIWCSIRNGFWDPERGLFVGDPEGISWRLAMPHEIPPQQQPDHLPDATEMVNTGWRNLHDLSPIMEPAPTRPDPPAPAGGLVDGICRELPLSPGEARAVVRVVAAWLRSDGPDWPSVASLLEQEANQ